MKMAEEVNSALKIKKYTPSKMVKTSNKRKIYLNILIAY
jgi:hypothetical protein